MARAARGFVLAAALTLLAPTAWAQTRTEVPIRAVTLSDGVVRYGVPVTINGEAVLAGLDTGAQGLRLQHDAPGRASARATARPETYAFGSGARLHGSAGQVKLAIGALSADLSAHLVDRVECQPGREGCPGRLGPGYGFLGDGLPGEGFKVLLGANMGRTTVDHPLRALGARRWIIDLPRPGEAGDGRLILNPTNEEVAGYSMVRLIGGYRPEGGGLDDALWSCLRNLATDAQVCGPALMDTGAFLIRINNAESRTPWAKDAPVEMDFRNDGATPRVTLSLKTGALAQDIRFTTAPVRGAVLQVGIAPYYAFSILYDPRGQIGFKPRNPLEGLPKAGPN